MVLLKVLKLKLKITATVYVCHTCSLCSPSDVLKLREHSQGLSAGLFLLM